MYFILENEAIVRICPTSVIKAKIQDATQKAQETYQNQIQQLEKETNTLKQQIKKFLNDIKWFNQQHPLFLLCDYPKELKQRFQFANHQEHLPTYDAFKANELELSAKLSESLIHAKRCKTAAHCFFGLALLSVSPIIVLSIGMVLIALPELISKLFLVGFMMELMSNGHAFDRIHQLIMNIGNLIQGFGPYLAIAGGALLLIAVGLYLYSAFQDKAPQMTIQDFSNPDDENTELRQEFLTKAFG